MLSVYVAGHNFHSQLVSCKKDKMLVQHVLECDVVEVNISCVLMIFGVTVRKNVLTPQVKYRTTHNP